MKKSSQFYLFFIILFLVCSSSAFSGTMTNLLNRINLSSSEGQVEIYFVKAPEYVDAMVLAADTAESYTIPTGAKRIIFSADGNYYARFDDGGDATVPSTEVVDGSSSFLNPAQLDITGVTSISFISSSARVITLAVYN